MKILTRTPAAKALIHSATGTNVKNTDKTITTSTIIIIILINPASSKITHASSSPLIISLTTIREPST